MVAIVDNWQVVAVSKQEEANEQREGRERGGGGGWAANKSG